MAERDDAELRKRSGPALDGSRTSEDDRESEVLLETLGLMIAERKTKNAEAAVSARASEPGRYPRLHLAGGKRAGRVGAARFKGRYVPHLIVDNDAAEPLRGS
jgi:hypothetical protein